jgi:hypothetical protein
MGTIFLEGWLQTNPGAVIFALVRAEVSLTTLTPLYVFTSAGQAIGVKALAGKNSLSSCLGG